MRTVAWYLAAAIAALSGALAGVGDRGAVGLWLLVIASGCLLAAGARSPGGIASLLLLFVAFHTAYILSGPFAALYGAGLPNVFAESHELGAFVVNAGLATAGLALGLLGASRERPPALLESEPADARSQARLRRLAVAWAVLASSMELVNLTRAGGLHAVYLGKAAYQSQVADLAFTLPSQSFAALATALFALGWACGSGVPPACVRRRRATEIVVFIVALGPVVGMSLLLGDRGGLLELALISWLGMNFCLRVRRLRLRWMVVGAVAYIGLGVLFAMRAAIGVSIAERRPELVLRPLSDPRRLAQAMNPASNEFGVPLGNFTAYARGDTSSPRYGATYLTALTVVVPASIYPGVKPQSPVYEFRDRYFPGEAERGEIGSTGFSSIVEAHMNGREAGVFLVYLLAGTVLAVIEVHRWRWRGKTGQYLYLLLVPGAMSFHRSDFASSVVGVGVLGAVLAVVTAGVLRLRLRPVD